MKKLLILSIMLTLALTASAKSKFTLMDNAAISPGTAKVMDSQQRPQQRRRAAVRQAQRRRAIARAHRPAPRRYARRGPAPRYHRPYHRPGPRPYGPRRGYRR